MKKTALPKTQDCLNVLKEAGTKALADTLTDLVSKEMGIKVPRYFAVHRAIEEAIARRTAPAEPLEPISGPAPPFPPKPTIITAAGEPTRIDF